ncbi:CLUMA_CG013826, isoform A [Clunio marinus]|nr:CLUMA_CG013826, isoform A [Clunio marinus]
MSSFDGKLQIAQIELDLCSKKPLPDHFIVPFYTFAIPSECPFRKNATICRKGTDVTVLPKVFKRLLPLFAENKSTKMRIEIHHDTGISCFEIEGKLTRSLKGN